jgi:hypothetical protein
MKKIKIRIRMRTVWTVYAISAALMIAGMELCTYSAIEWVNVVGIIIRALGWTVAICLALVLTLKIFNIEFIDNDKNNTQTIARHTERNAVKEELWKASEDGFTVFSYYFGHDPKLKDPRHHFKIRSEKTASARLSYFKGLWRITDFGNQNEINGMNAIDFVMYRENLTFDDAVKYIWEVILHRNETDNGENYK